MNLDDLNHLVTDVFGPNTDRKVINGWLSIRCPISQWTHEKGADTRASSGISIQDNATSVFNCYTCQTKVPLQELIRRYAEFSGEDLDALIAELEDEAYLGPRTIAKWGAPVIPQNLRPPTPINAELYMDLYDSAAGHRYLRKRGISDDTADFLELKVDPADPADGCERILFPVKGIEGLLYGFSGRDTTGRAKLKVRDYAGLEKAKCLLGAHLIEKERPQFICLVEGLFDYANMWQQGYPGLATMTSTLTKMQADLLKDIGLPVYFFFDDDKAGDGAMKTAAEALRRHVPIMKVRYPEIWVEDETEEGGGHFVKDPGELLAEDIEAMLADAILY